MHEFLSEENIAVHREYVRSLRLKYSILEKSIIGIKNKTPREILRQKMKREEKADVLSLLSELVLHDTFWESFKDDNPRNSDIIRLYYGSEDAFRYDLIRAGVDIRYGFLCIYLREGKLYYKASDDYISLVIPNIPVLAVDVCEHAYFLDYGFDRERYLSRAVSNLNLSVIGKNEKDT